MQKLRFAKMLIFLDTIRNIVIAPGRMAGISKTQWNRFTDALLDL